MFYIGDINTVQPPIVGPVIPSIYRSSKRVSLYFLVVVGIWSQAEFMHAQGNYTEQILEMYPPFLIRAHTTCNVL